MIQRDIVKHVINHSVIAVDFILIFHHKYQQMTHIHDKEMIMRIQNALLIICLWR